MEYKAVILDLDGTTLNEHHHISEYTESVIKKISHKGVKVIIATGRGYPEGVFAVNQLKLNSGFITNNGSKIYDGMEHNLIKEFVVDKTITNEIIDYKIDDDILLNIFTNDDWFVNKEITDEGLIKSQEISNYFAIVKNMEEFRDKDITKSVYLGDRDKLEKIHKYFNDNFNQYINAMFSSFDCLEIINKDTSKAHAAEIILNSHNLDLKDAIAIGDGFNDYDMISMAGKGFIMGNAHPDLKNALPHIEVIDNNTNDGVAKKLEEIFLTDF